MLRHALFFRLATWRQAQLVQLLQLVQVLAAERVQAGGCCWRMKLGLIVDIIVIMSVASTFARNQAAICEALAHLVGLLLLLTSTGLVSRLSQCPLAHLVGQLNGVAPIEMDVRLATVAQLSPPARQRARLACNAELAAGLRRVMVSALAEAVPAAARRVVEAHYGRELKWWLLLRLLVELLVGWSSFLPSLSLLFFSSFPLLDSLLWLATISYGSRWPASLAHYLLLLLVDNRRLERGARQIRQTTARTYTPKQDKMAPRWRWHLLNFQMVAWLEEEPTHMHKQFLILARLIPRGPISCVILQFVTPQTTTKLKDRTATTTTITTNTRPSSPLGCRQLASSSQGASSSRSLNRWSLLVPPGGWAQICKTSRLSFLLNASLKRATCVC